MPRTLPFRAELKVSEPRGSQLTAQNPLVASGPALQKNSQVVRNVCGSGWGCTEDVCDRSARSSKVYRWWFTWISFISRVWRRNCCAACLASCTSPLAASHHGSAGLVRTSSPVTLMSHLISQPSCISCDVTHTTTADLCSGQMIICFGPVRSPPYKWPYLEIIFTAA